MELNGYPSYESIPHYRKLKGELVGLDRQQLEVVVKGFIEAFDKEDKLKVFTLSEDILQIESWLQQPQPRLRKKIGQPLLQTMQTLMKCPHDFAVAINICSLNKVTSTVRTKTLEWIASLPDRDSGDTDYVKASDKGFNTVFNGPVTQILAPVNGENVAVGNSGSEIVQNKINEEKVHAAAPKSTIATWVAPIVCGVIVAVISLLISNHFK